MEPEVRDDLPTTPPIQAAPGGRHHDHHAIVNYSGNEYRLHQTYQGVPLVANPPALRYPFNATLYKLEEDRNRLQATNYLLPGPLEVFHIKLRLAGEPLSPWVIYRDWHRRTEDLRKYDDDTNWILNTWNATTNSNIRKYFEELFAASSPTYHALNTPFKYVHFDGKTGKTRNKRSVNARQIDSGHQDKSAAVGNGSNTPLVETYILQGTKTWENTVGPMSLLTLLSYSASQLATLPTYSHND